MERPLVHIYIKERSWIARIAASKLGAKSGLAIVFFRTIYLHGLTKSQLIRNIPMLRHEVMHVMQYREHYWIPFLLKYLYYSIRYGYYQNPFEIEAREAEQNEQLLQEVKIH